MAYLSGWKTQRIKITIDQDKIDTADLTWFPDTVLLTVTNAHKVFLELTTDAEYLKVAFTKADGTTQLYAEMELFDVSEEKAIFHVSRDGWVINYNADTIFYMYYDSTHENNTDYIGIKGLAGRDGPRENVWDGNYKMVQHGADETTSTITDSTSNNNDGTKKGVNEPVEAAGKVGQGQDFDGVNDYISLAAHSTLNPETGSFTVEAVAKSSGSAVSRDIVDNREGAANGEGYFLLLASSSGTMKFAIEDHNGNQLIITSNSACFDGNYHHFVGVRDVIADKLKVYFDGAPDANDVTDPTNSTVNSTTNVIIGQSPLLVNQFPFDDIIDELRISKAAAPRTPEWIKATKASLWDELQTYEYDDITILELSETLSIADTKTTSGILAKAETLSIVDTLGALITFLETLSIADSEVTSGELGLDETLSITDTWSAVITLFETLSIADSAIFGTTKQLSESFSIIDSKLLTGSLGLTETLGIADSAVYQCIKTLYETLSIIDTKITSGSLSVAETLSIADSWTVLFNLLETLSITDTISTTGTKTLNELLHLIDTFIRWIEHPIFTEPVKSISSFTEPTKTNPIYTEPAKSNPTFVKPTKGSPVYTEPTKGNPIYTEPTKKIQI